MHQVSEAHLGAHHLDDARFSRLGKGCEVLRGHQGKDAALRIEALDPPELIAGWLVLPVKVQNHRIGRADHRATFRDRRQVGEHPKGRRTLTEHGERLAKQGMPLNE